MGIIKEHKSMYGQGESFRLLRFLLQTGFCIFDQQPSSVRSRCCVHM